MLYEESLKNHSLNWMHEWIPYYNWEGTEQRSPPPRVPLLFITALFQKSCVNSKATSWFLSVCNFQFSYPWKPCSVTSWFPRINLSVVTYLPIRFLETAHMSQYDNIHVPVSKIWHGTVTFGMNVVQLEVIPSLSFSILISCCQSH
jgi:hypothetical protein